MATWQHGMRIEKKIKKKDRRWLWGIMVSRFKQTKKKKKWDEQCFEKEAEEYSWIKSWKIIARLWGRVLQDL